MKFTGSTTFFWCVVGFFVLQAAWIALSGQYPMAFDEEFHLGIIRLYADHISPFWSAHPANGDAFGAVARDPSYLYHWLMSFPYRLISLFTNNQTLQVIILRGLNIALFASCLPLFRRILLKTRASSALVNLCLLVFVLVPVVPLLASQINYDNLIMPLTALALLLTIKLNTSIRSTKLDVISLCQLIIVCLAASLVKYAFLPMFMAILIFVCVQVWRTYRSSKKLASAINKGWGRLAGWPKWLMLIALLLTSILFVERFGVNSIKYHRPAPDCGQVLSYDHCQHYGPWIRDYNLELSKGDADRSPLTFNGEWWRGMWLRSFFSLAGPNLDYQTRGPLRLPAQGTIIFAVIGGLALLLSFPGLWRRYNRSVLSLLLLATFIHIAVLWLEQYRLFLQAGKAVAINGRYLMPVLPFLIILPALAVNELLGRHRALKGAVAAIVIFCFLWGGGTLTFILRSNDSWYWNSGVVRSANHTVQNVFGPITPGYNDPSEFLR
jgi:hypothetical protein